MQLPVKMGIKAKVKGEIDVESSVKGKRWSCLALYLQKVAYKSVWCEFEQRYEARCGRQRWANTVHIISVAA